MPPKKGGKKAQKRDNGTVNEKKWTIEEAINSDSWRCVVVMAIERTHQDCFVLREFIEECSNGRRQEISLIDFDTFVMKILNDFADGELPYKYAFLLNFSSVFQEAVDYINKKMDIPILVLVKVVKALLFYLREENLVRIAKMSAGFQDPIKAMAERPSNLDSFEDKKKDVTKRGDNGFKVRPPSVTKQDTELLKRGERAKDDQCIDDAPQNAYFNLYVLLTGFYNPDFPLELIKANVPLHGILCIDTSLSGVKRESSFTRRKFHKRFPEITQKEEIQNFWDVFLKNIWDPKVSLYFKNTVFQVYLPRRLLCEKKKLREFIYREISFLMYDMSDLKRQLNNYLDHMHLWDVAERELKESEASRTAPIWPENLPNECMTVPVILRCAIDAVCGSALRYLQSVSTDSIHSEGMEWGSIPNHISSSKKAIHGSCAWLEQELVERGDFNLMNVYLKTQELDAKYGLDNKSSPSDDSGKAFTKMDSIQAKNNFQASVCSGINGETLFSLDSVFQSYWKKYSTEAKTICAIDYFLYALLMTKVFCPYQRNVETPSSEWSNHSIKEMKSFEPIKNISSEMRKPHFTVTDGSRSILKAAPYDMKNTSRDFFCPEQYKVVSPEKLKASSAPEFRVTPTIKLQKLYTSEILPVEILNNPFETLRSVGECLFSNANDFDFLEFLSRPKLLEKERDHLDNYNCMDHSYSVLNDCIFLRLHNRKDSQNFHHETFNVMLKTAVGLRDFYDYVLEDEAHWLMLQEESYQIRTLLANKVIPSESFRDFTDSDFWLPDSIKYREFGRHLGESKIHEVRTEESNMEELQRVRVSIRTKTSDPYNFEGYNASDMAIQLSGLKTIYYADDCSVTVQLIERLYGNQDLGVHVRQAAHVLHLYSYVCPEPHILDPFTFHVTYKNGIILAFSRRLTEMFEEVEEKIESITTIKSKNSSSEFSTRVVKSRIPKSVKDEEFKYDMAASLPNGLSIRTVRRVVTPCYIKQCYLVDDDETAVLENSRLFLPNGDVIKMMKNNTVQVLKVDASITTASLSDMTGGKEGKNLSFSRCETISGEGYACVFEQGKIISSKRFQVFQNTDMESNQIFFRRRDGTNYVLQSDGTLCVQFGDGTKMSSSLLVEEAKSVGKNESGSGEGKKAFDEADAGDDFVFVFTEITAEHPDYATVIYNGQTQKWKILLPYDSTITIEPRGRYFIDIDKHTELQVEDDLIRMNSFSCEREPQCAFTADLSVFENKEGGLYCHMKDSTGKIFIIEGNSNCYILDDGEQRGNLQESLVQVRSKESEYSEFIASADLDICQSTTTHKDNKLIRGNKYLVLNRDMTGMEVIHRDDVSKALTRTEKGSVVFTQDIPGTANRCFVLVTPINRKEIKKWGVESILPNPKFEPMANERVSSSTYGVPPSWMHPFPNRKYKFVVPQPLTCRVFVETKKTELSPDIGTLECCFCEMHDVKEAKHSEIPPEGIDEYLKRLSNDDQDLLTEIYSIAAASLINEKKKLKPTNSEKLEHYLEKSRYYVAMREYHKKCIRYHIVPNYFHHPAGMSWLILNQLLLELRLPEEKCQKVILLERAADSDRSLPLPESTSGFSKEEIEYNLPASAGQSFSSLSYRSNLSAQTAPTILTTGGICSCKVKAVKDTASSPVVKCYWNNETFLEQTFEEPRWRICEFQENDIDMLQKKEPENDMSIMSLEDLMHLGLI